MGDFIIYSCNQITILTPSPPPNKKPNRSSTESTVLQILTLLEFFKFLRGDMKCLVLGKGLMVCKADNW